MRSLYGQLFSSWEKVYVGNEIIIRISEDLIQKKKVVNRISISLRLEWSHQIGPEYMKSIKNLLCHPSPQDGLAKGSRTP